MLKKQVRIVCLFLTSTILTSTRVYAQNRKQITQPNTDKNVNKKTFIISSHHLSAPTFIQINSLFKNYKSHKKIPLFEIANCILKSNIEFEIYNNFYLKTNFFNNVLSIYAMVNETKNSNLNNIIISINKSERIKEFKAFEFFSFLIGKKISYGQSNNMFGIEFGFNISIGKENEDFIKKLGIIITLIPYRRAFENGIHISTGHIIINLVSLYDIFKHNKEDGTIKFSFLLGLLLHTLTLHIGYIKR